MKARATFGYRLGWNAAILVSMAVMGAGGVSRHPQAAYAAEASEIAPLGQPIDRVSSPIERPCCSNAAQRSVASASVQAEPAGEKQPSAPAKAESASDKPTPEHKEVQGVWRPLFNGKDLQGWTPKIRGFPLGENYGNTFRVENGVLKVVYEPDKYPKFDNRFGHLFYREKFSHYRLRVEYRFVGQQCAGGPGWAFRNSGIMLHCQDPKTMTVEQSFPVSIEVQLLGGGGTGQRPTANLCTPGTHVVMDGKLFTPHCTNSRSKTYHGDQWVTVEVEVHGAGAIRHYVNGELVLEYEKPQLDDRDPDAKRLLAAGADRLLKEGYIALQSESHPIEFRKVEMMVLPESAGK